MVSKILDKGQVYFCSNCRMRLFELTPNCKFCGNMFSNYEEIITEQELKKQETMTNENNIYGRN